MATPLDPKQTVSFEELLMSQVVQQEVLTRLLIQKGIFTKEESTEIVKMVDREMEREKINKKARQRWYTVSRHQTLYSGDSRKVNRVGWLSERGKINGLP